MTCKRILLAIVACAAACTRAPLSTTTEPATGVDPRVGLRAGWLNAGTAIWNLEQVAFREKAPELVDRASPGNFRYINSDLAFSGNYLFQGNFRGMQIWDISNGRAPTLRKTLVCPGGQFDMSVYRNLLFVSVEETYSRVDCGIQGIRDSVSAERFRGVRIFDISNIDAPRQLAAVQACRGSHTHTLVENPNDPANLYVYISGTAGVRSPSELAGCSSLPPEQDPNTSLFRIEIIRVPLAAPQDARIVNAPRIFADAQGRIAGLWRGGAHGTGTQQTAVTNQCHDITVYSAIGLAAGACSGNGILLDISDPANPRRVHEVVDPNFAYWHSATFSNDGSKVVFTDEWGGGQGARCRATDKPQWGADAIFTIDQRRLNLKSYYKIPAPQTPMENCVAHNGSLVPVPGRDILVQGWYQGGVSVMDFTDPEHPYEIAFFDRGPVDTATAIVTGGSWSAYWYNGYIYNSEIARGLDVLDLKPSAYLSQNEIDAAKSVRYDAFNVQNQKRIVWPASFVVARAYVDGLERAGGLGRPWATEVRAELTRAERLSGAQRQGALSQLAVRLDRDAQGVNTARVRALAATVREIAR